MYCVAILRLQTRYVNSFRPPDKSPPTRLAKTKSRFCTVPTGMARRARPAVGHPLKDSPLVPGGTTWLVNERGQPFAARAFSKWFGKRCRMPLPHLSAHGLRKAAMRRMAEAGWSETQMGAWSGHDSKREVARCTAAASQGPYDKGCPGAQTGNMG
jgi:integrase